MSEHEIIYGRQSILEVLKAGRRAIQGLHVAPGTRPTGTAAEILAQARRLGVPVLDTDKRDLDRWTLSGHHQGMALQTALYPYVDFEDLVRVAERGPEPAFLLVFDHLQDPQNAGSLLRTAEAAGVQGIILATDRAVAVTPAVVRASSGASEHLQVAMVNSLARILGLLKQKGIWVWGLDTAPELPLHTAVRLEGPVALVVGSEGEGLSRLVSSTCDGLMRLPMRGRIGSLNASIAGAIALYEIRRQRDATGARSQARTSAVPNSTGVLP